jgi:N-acetylglucosamine kinase-like BadF-type ATPase
MPDPRRGPVAVGVDLGGTWLRARVVDAAGRRRDARMPAPAAPALPAALGRLWRRLGLRPARVAGLAVAARGVWTPGERRALARRLRGLAARVEVLSDAGAALEGALGDEPGVLVLAGTGSLALARDGRGRLARAGGLGPLLGDEGSAFAIGRAWLGERAAAAPEATRRAIARLRVGEPGAPARIAALAPAVLAAARRGDARARRAVRRAQQALASLLARAAKARGLASPVHVSWAGGLMARPAFRAGVWRDAARLGLRVAPRAPRGSALEAAARRAQALAGSSGRALRPRRAAARRRRAATRPRPPAR